MAFASIIAHAQKWCGHPAVLKNYKIFDRFSASLIWWLWSIQKQPPEVFYLKRCSYKFTKFTRQGLCQILFFNKRKACTFIKKETLAQVFSCEFCETSKNTFSPRASPVAASINREWIDALVLKVSYGLLEEFYRVRCKKKQTWW